MLNRAASVESYPIPHIEDLLASFGNAKVFSKLDVSHAYQQLEFDDDSKYFVTITTHKGLYKYNRLPFGVASAPAIFQRTMETLLRDVGNVCVYIDDILVCGSTEGEHLATLHRVLERLQQAGFRLKLAKCIFNVPSVEYLGYVITASGVRPVEKKVSAILKAPAPKNMTELKSFLGMLNYYRKFLPHIASTLAPLHSLIQKNKSWTWGGEQQAAFNNANADCLSRLPVQECQKPVDEVQGKEVLMLETTLSTKVMEEHADKDQVLARVKGMILLGKWDSKGRNRQTWNHISNGSWILLELSLADGCILWGSRVVVATKLRPEVLQTLHEAHPGVVRMKALARGTVWWPWVDKDIEHKVKACARCQVNRKTPPPVPLHPWEFPAQAWSRLHVDFACPFRGKLFIVRVDAHSKGLEVAVVSSCSSQCSIKFLRNVFATHGIPEQLVSDNGSAFTSSEFKEFVDRNGIRHAGSSRYGRGRDTIYSPIQ